MFKKLGLYALVLVVDCAALTQTFALLSAKSDAKLILGLVLLVAGAGANLWFIEREAKEFKRSQKEE